MKAALQRLALCALPLLAAAPAKALDCTLLKSIYAPIDADDDMSADSGKQNDYALTFAPSHGEINQATFVMRIAEAKQKLAYEFAFAFPNGYGGTALVFLGAPGQKKFKDARDDPGSKIMYFGADLKRVQPEGDVDGPAPAYLVMPGLGQSFWYWSKGERKFVPPDGLWKLTGCR